MAIGEFVPNSLLWFRSTGGKTARIVAIDRLYGNVSTTAAYAKVLIGIEFTSRHLTICQLWGNLAGGSDRPCKSINGRGAVCQPVSRSPSERRVHGMASRHLNWFRRHQKAMLVVLGVILMVTFTVGTSISLFTTDRPNSRQDEVAVTWTKGKVRESELISLRQRHIVAYSFLANVIREALERGGAPIINGQPLRKDRPVEMQDIGISREASDEMLMMTMLMAEEGRRHGIVVSREAVKDFLRQLSSPELGEADWLDIAQQVIGEHQNLTVIQVFEHLAYELRAQHMWMLASSGFGGVPPPGELWDYFNRLNRRVSIEAFPIDVVSLAAQVRGEPTAAELQKLFDDGRFRDPNPAIQEPGFHKPHKVAFDYLRVDFKPLLDAAKKQITDEKIEEQYKKDISQGMHKVLELPGFKPGDEKKDGDKPAEEKKEGEKPADDKKEADKSEEKKSDGEKPAEPKPGEKPAEPPKEGCQDAVQPAAEPKPGEKPAEEKPAEKAGDKPAGEKPADAKPTDEKADDKKSPDAKAEEPKPEPKFKPLEEVREEIRTKLAQPIAQEAQTKAVKEVMDAINDYGRRYRRWQSVKDFKKGTAQDPGKLDLAALAKKYEGFQVGSLPLVDRFQAMETELGKNVQSFDFAALQRGDQNFMRSFVNLAFGDDDALYTPQEANSVLPDISYIFFRTDEQKAADVTFDEVKQQIVEAWKKQKAYELALADAQKLADKAKGAKALRDIVGDPANVITPPPFSWMTTGSLAMGFGEPGISRVPNIDYAGNEFMKVVFGLKADETGATPNEPHTQVYVVRLVGQEPSDEILRQQFLDTGLNFQVLGVAQRERQRINIEWYRELEKQYQLTWQRPPRELGRRM